MKAVNATLARLSPLAIVVLRVILGGTMFWHGLKKFDGGISGVKGFYDFLNIPAPGLMAYVVALLELVGGILIVLGIGTRVIAALFVVELLVAVFLYKYGKDVGFIGAKEAGAELDWALIAGFFALAGLGAGSLSVDAKAGLDDRLTIA
jgi:putative oxidoreductase